MRYPGRAEKSPLTELERRVGRLDFEGLLVEGHASFPP